MVDQPITDRLQRTSRAFVAIEGTYGEMALRATQGGVRIWLDNGTQKQAIRQIGGGLTDEGAPTVRFMIRTSDDDGRSLHSQLEVEADQPLEWYEEVRP